MNEIIDHWQDGNRIAVRVEGSEGPKHLRIAGGWAANYAKRNGVRLVKDHDRRSWTHGFLHRTDVYYRVEAK